MNIPPFVQKISRTLRQHGYQAWVVGGSIRDLLIDREVYDYDLATDALPEQVMKLFKRTIPTGIKHGTVTVLTTGSPVEVTTFRVESAYSDARRPDQVSFASSIEEDLSRRDFTINGMAYDPESGVLVDPFGGREDLKKGIIRTIGDPAERFAEDGLRPYRACRFASQLEFDIDETTMDAIPGCLSYAAQVSAERIRDEFVKIIKSPRPSRGIELLRMSGLINIFLPELLAGYGIRQNKFHRYDIYYHNLYACDAADPSDYRVRLAALFHDIGKYEAKREVEEKNTGTKSVFYNHEIIGAAITKRIMRRLKFSNEDIKLVIHLIRCHMFHYTSQWTDGAVRRFMRKVGLENLDRLFELRKADRIGNGLKRGESKSVANLKKRIEKVIEEENAITVRDLAINGHDLMREFDLKPGPVIGATLNYLLEEIMDDPDKNEYDTLLQLARDYLKTGRQERAESPARANT